MKRKSFCQVKDRLAEDIKTARAKIGLSQEALAHAAEVDRTYVSQLERGVANPSIQILHRIAAALGSELSISLVNISNEPRDL
ncbi:helix-turn-helix transcriptional regulator [Noviherbaspirillum sp. 1P10PC]|uniref:helix-turn-helix domain-containing protein n=1 Tax=Noviherbaspirillum sp. 1P10PC TaxID=3132292 RepID=UPI0039A17991